MRVATFNVENLDDKASDKNPSLAQRKPVLEAAFRRLDADIICLQEVHGQELPNHNSRQPQRTLSALASILSDTQYRDFQQVSTVTSSNVPYDERNLVILSRYPISQHQQLRNDHIDRLLYRKVTAIPHELEAKPVNWERPILHARIAHPELGTLHIINLHLKSRLPSTIAGQKEGYSWQSAAGWAEGYFLSSIKRVGQALETRILLDTIFDGEPEAKIIVCGDFNASPGEVPVEAICGRVENTDNPLLRQRVLIPCSSAIAESVRFSHLHQGHGNLLDHMLISQALLPYFRDAQIHNENLHDESLPFTTDIKYPESDHAPFVSSFAD